MPTRGLGGAAEELRSGLFIIDQQSTWLTIRVDFLSGPEAHYKVYDSDGTNIAYCYLWQNSHALTGRVFKAKKYDNTDFMPGEMVRVGFDVFATGQILILKSITVDTTGDGEYNQ